MFIVRPAGRVELRQEFHVHADCHHFTPDGVRIAAAGRTTNIVLLTEGHSLAMNGFRVCGHPLPWVRFRVFGLSKRSPAQLSKRSPARAAPNGP